MKTGTRFLASLLSILYSCGPAYKQEIKTIDSLENEISVRLKKYDALDLENLNQIALKAKSNTARLKQVVTDTIDQELGRLMTIYKDYRKADLDMYRRFLQLKEELQYSQSQLNNLSTDLSKNSINKDSVRYYLELEKNASVQVIKQFEDMSSMLPQYYQTFDSVNTLLIQKIEFLESAKKQK